MTRGTFVVCTDGGALYTTTEFNGDMGPDMVNGERFGLMFARDVKTLDDFEKFAEKVVKDYGYEDDFEERDSFLYKDVSLDGTSEEHPFDVNAAWSETFNLSDYGYFKNLSKSDVWLKDENGVVECIPPNGFECFCFGCLCEGDDYKAVQAMRGELKPWD